VLCGRKCNSFLLQKEEDVERSFWWKIIWYSDITKGDGVFVTVISQKIALKLRIALQVMLKGDLD